MKLRALAPVAAAAVLTFPAVSHAVAPYHQNFETLNIGSSTALSADGWIVYGNATSPDDSYGYGTFPAPNGGGAFSAIVNDQGGGVGTAQGTQQLSIYNDYNNGDHGKGYTIEALVFQERKLAAGDAGMYVFTFDAKKGLLGGNPPSTAQAFVKVLDPAAGFSAMLSLSANMTGISGKDWDTFSIPFTITPAMETFVGGNRNKKVLQFGFSSTATAYQPTGVFYDNINVTAVPEPSTYAMLIGGLALLGFMRRRRAH